MADPKDIKLSQEAGPKYKLINEIKENPLYKRSDRDIPARKFLERNLTPKPMGHSAVPGQLIMFEYFEPKTKEQLQYWDGNPTTIFFGTFQSKEGLRILGFNIHYYPPKMRFQIMNRIFEMYKPIYSKYFTEPLTKEIDAFDYKYLMDALKRGKLDFGVREYIPELCGKTWAIPANMWQVAVFTEGHFKKETRANILKYWEEWKSGYYDKSKKKKKKGTGSTENNIGGDNKPKKDSFLNRLLSRFKRKIE